MSECQYYEFVAMDRPLDPNELGALQELSTLAHITLTSFVNASHWVNFMVDPCEVTVPADCARRVEQVRHEHARKPAFFARLTNAGL